MLYSPFCPKRQLPLSYHARPLVRSIVLDLCAGCAAEKPRDSQIIMPSYFTPVDHQHLHPQVNQNRARTHDDGSRNNHTDGRTISRFSILDAATSLPTIIPRNHGWASRLPPVAPHTTDLHAGPSRQWRRSGGTGDRQSLEGARPLDDVVDGSLKRTAEG